MLQRRLILFDVDGTLVDTGGAGKRALHRAFAEVFHPDDPQALTRIAERTNGVRFAGMTDPSIVLALAQALGVADALPAACEVVESRYLDALRDEMAEPCTVRRVIPGIPQLLEFIGIEGVRLINTPYAVLIGIIYGYLPLMVFPIYVSLEKFDQRLLEASEDLGATPLKTFRDVTLPLSIPGIATGCMLVFILLMGEFLIPALLGGGKVFFVGNALVDLFLQSRNWTYGSAVAAALVIIMLVTVSLYMKLIMRGAGHREDVSMI